MIKYQKNPLLEVVGSPLIIRREATETHNEVTVAIVKYSFPLASFLSNGGKDVCYEILDTITSAAAGFPNINFRVVGSPLAPVFTFSVKAKTERRGNDVHNQQLADKIVLAKANIKAQTVLKTVLEGNSKVIGLIGYYKEQAARLSEISDYLSQFARRETKFIENV